MALHEARADLFEEELDPRKADIAPVAIHHFAGNPAGKDGPLAGYQANGHSPLTRDYLHALAKINRFATNGRDE
jgi:hypothetical protein